MIKVRHISGIWTSREVSILQSYGIAISSGFKSFSIEENDTYHELIKKIQPKPKKLFSASSVKNFRDVPVAVKFSQEEIDAASYFWMEVRNIGYPYPEVINEYRKRVFKDACLYQDTKSCCGNHANQVESFYLANELKVGGNNLLFSLNWEQDSIFTTKDFFEDFFKPKGFDSWDVYLKSDQKKSKNIVQIKLPISTSSLDLKNSNLIETQEKCACCGNERFDIRITDFMPPFKTDPEMDFFLTQETFGNGGETFRRVCISEKFLKELKEHFKIKNHNLTPSRD
jgi:hypothetical protein